jgi:outer membrane protein TolC
VQLATQKAKSEEYQTSLNQMPMSQAIEARVKLADEKAAYVQALADYKVALCKLDRAVGEWGRFSKFKPVTTGGK